MIRHLIPCAAAVALAVVSCSAQEKIELKDAKQKSSYAIGMDIGNNFKKQEIEIDARAWAAGLSDALPGAKTQLTEAEAKTVLTEFRTQMMAKMQEKEKNAG